METTEVIIARLVLGYLKDEKCRTAYKEFIKASRHLQSGSMTRSKYLPTRFIGLTLTDILSEYFEISSIVQGRLEVTNYYNESHTKTSIVQQLLYLLSKGHSSRTSTPCPRSPMESNLDETSPSHGGQISDVETTPAHTLPGNIQSIGEDSYLYNSSRRKSKSKLNKSTSAASDETGDPEHISPEVLAQTLLENKEFHEKIAQTINKVAEKQYRVGLELDRTIKTVVKETEADPIFDKILEEIIGSTSAIENHVETSSTTSSIHKDVTDDLRNKARKSHKPVSEHSVDELDKSNLKTQFNPDRVEEHNEEAIRSIVANSHLQAENNQECQMNNDITVFNGSLDKYLISNTCNANTQTQPVHNPLYINTTGGLLMVPSSVQSNGSIQGGDSSTKQIYLVNKPSMVNWIPPIQNTPILTERDILAMPTVIVSDDRQSRLNPCGQILQTPVVKPPKKISILPNPTIEIAPEFLKSLNDPNSNFSMPTKKTKSNKKTQNSASCQSLIDLDVAPVSNASNDLLKTVEPINKIANKSSEANANTIKEQSTPSPTSESVQKTPKSGSHVRNLDFSTPPKITSTNRKSVRNKRINRSPRCAQKKKICKSLVNSDPVDEDKSLGNLKDRKTWDADLRANILPKDKNDISPKEKLSRRKKKSPFKKVKRRIKNNNIEQQLNTTEHDAACIEAALQTPVKVPDRITASSDELNNSKVPEYNENGETSSVNNSEKDMETVHNNNSKTSIECLDNNSKQGSPGSAIKTVLSPSKLNTSKRKLIKSDIIESVVSTITEEIDKFITPEITRENIQYPIKANKNITSLFETPLKNDSIPKTSGNESPNTTITPFSKMLEANLGIDISSLPTPNLPITPNFPPVTPCADTRSPYCNRPTDYSTSSSYYHPSDSEPNRCLEANVIELEKCRTVVESFNDKTDETCVLEVGENTRKCKSITSLVDERLKVFNENIIGKKNLNLVKKNMPKHNLSSDFSSESSNEGEIDSSCSWVEKSNETIIRSSKSCLDTPRRTYALRNRTNKKEEMVKENASVKQVDKDAKANSRPTQKCARSESVDKQFKQIESSSVAEQEVVKRKVTDDTDFQKRLKKELNEKLQRTVNKIKNSEKSSTKKIAGKSNGAFMKIKLLPTSTKNKRKPKFQQNHKKSNPKESVNDKISSESKIKDDKKKVQTVKEIEKGDKSSSDIEAQNLIEGLKERGIHLMKNKSSPNKKYNETCTISEIDKGPDINNISVRGNEENPHERSSSELETEWRDTYDTITFKGEHLRIIYDQTKQVKKTEYDTSVLNKTFVGKVYIEEINDEIDIPLVVTPFHTLLDITSTKSVSRKQNETNQRVKGGVKKSEEKLGSVDSTARTETNKNSAGLLHDAVSKDNLANFSLQGHSREDVELEAPSQKKRKIEDESCRVPEEKKCKNLLQQINVDTFLNNIYGNSTL